MPRDVASITPQLHQKAQEHTENKDTAGKTAPPRKRHFDRGQRKPRNVTETPILE